MRKFLGFAVAAVAGGTFAVAAPALATPMPVVRCGVTLTQSARLDHDMYCPSSNGVTLAAAVTLDLGGHRLVGAKASDSNGSGYVAVLAINPTGIASVRNGTIQGWSTGTGSQPFEGFPANFAVRHVNYKYNGYAIDGNGSHFSIDDSVISFNGVGSIIGPTSGFGTATRTVFSDNGLAMGVDYGGSMTVDRSRVEHNQTGISCSETAVYVTNSVISANNVGVTGGDGCGVDISTSHLDRNSVAIDYTTFWGGVSLTKSHLAGNGIAFRGGSVDTVTDDTFVGNGWAYQIGIQEPDPVIIAQDLERNIFLNNGNAIYIATTDPDASAATINIGKNVVVKNAGYGIYVPLATDLGGNVAFANGHKPQCVGVVCSLR